MQQSGQRRCLTQEQELLPSDAGQEFAYAVSINGDVAAIGMPLGDTGGVDAGAVYIFRFDSGSSTWSQEMGPKRLAGR